MPMPTADYAEKSSEEMAGDAKLAARCTESRSTTFGTGASWATIRSVISLPCAPTATERFKRDGTGLRGARPVAMAMEATAIALCIEPAQHSCLLP